MCVGSIETYLLGKNEDINHRRVAVKKIGVFLLSSGKGFFHFINYDLIHTVDSPSNMIVTT
jgi:hypothetical protein